MANSKRKCGGCGSYFRPETTFPGPVAWCSFECAMRISGKRKEAAQKRLQQEARKEHRQAKERVKTRSEWLKEAQAAVNAYVRERDRDLPCVSCGRRHEGQYHAGHYRSVGSCPELRFDIRQIHKQCSPCNNYLSGNLLNYRPELIRRIGQAAVDEIEGPHEQKKYTVDDLKAIKAEYKAKLKALRQSE